MILRNRFKNKPLALAYTCDSRVLGTTKNLHDAFSDGQLSH